MCSKPYRFALLVCIDDQLSRRPAGGGRFWMRQRQNDLSTLHPAEICVTFCATLRRPLSTVRYTLFLFSRISQKPFCDMWDVTARHVQSFWPDRGTRFAIYSQPIARRSQPMSLTEALRSITNDAVELQKRTKNSPRRLARGRRRLKGILGNSFGTFPETVS